MGKTNRERVLDWWLKFRMQHNWHTQPDFDPMLVDSITELINDTILVERTKWRIVEGPSGWLCNGAFIPNDAHYRSTGKPYDIELTRDGAKVTARVWDMPEEVRGKLNLIEDNKHYRISSANMPSINEYEKVLWIRGTCTLEDNGTMRNIFSSTTDARDYLQHITALIDRLNAEYKPQFDTEEATKQILELKREIEQAELTIDTLKQAMYVKDCEIIRLEQELCVRPPLDTEKVKEKIETLREFSCLFGQFYNRPSHWKFDYYQEEVRKAVKHLLTALGLEPDA